VNLTTTYNSKATRPCKNCRAPAHGDARYCYVCSAALLSSARIFTHIKAARV
jgi:hypothetical protein